MKPLYTITEEQYNKLHKDFKGRSIEHPELRVLTYLGKGGTTLIFEGKHFEVVKHTSQNINPVPGYETIVRNFEALDKAIRPYIHTSEPYALTVLLDGRVGIAVEGEQGYYPTGVKFDKRNMFRETADEVIMRWNTEIGGLTEKEAFTIVLRSMAKS